MRIYLKQMLFMQTNGGSSGIKRGAGKGASSRREDTVRGVPQSTIDKLRGERDHLSAGEHSWEVIQDDYKRVGITITEQEAKDIWKSVRHFSCGSDTVMRKAYKLEMNGRAHDLTPDQKIALAEYKLCMEYCKVMPLIPSSRYSTVYRGIKISTITPEYSKELLSKKVGDKWDVDRMPTSFSTSLQTAKSFSWHNGKKGIIMHMPTQKMKNAPSIKGISFFSNEDEVFVADYNWKISKIRDRRKDSNDGYYHIYLEHE